MGSRQTEAATSAEEGAATSAEEGAATSATSAAAATAATAAGAAGSNPQGGSPASQTSSPIEGFQVHCFMNARYHAAREGFLDAVHRWFMFGVIVLGASAIGAVAAKFAVFDWFNLLCGAGASVIGALDLTFDLSNRARAHALMKRRYFELLADVADGRRGLPEAEACLHRYSADEEPAYMALIAASWNAAQEMVYGDAAYAYKIPGWHRFWRNILRFEGKQFPLEKRANAGPLVTTR
jgi:hypothetical protein